MDESATAQWVSSQCSCSATFHVPLLSSCWNHDSSRCRRMCRNSSRCPKSSRRRGAPNQPRTAIARPHLIDVIWLPAGWQPINGGKFSYRRSEISVQQPEMHIPKGHGYRVRPNGSMSTHIRRSCCTEQCEQTRFRCVLRTGCAKEDVALTRGCSRRISGLHTRYTACAFLTPQSTERM